MLHAVLVDPSSSIKRILCESFVSSVVAGSTYLFHNLTVPKDKSGTAVSITDVFQETLAVADKHQQSILPQLQLEKSLE